MKKLLAASAVTGSLASAILAQPQAPTLPTPVAGARAGTQSWIVHFESRPFDLLAFREEMHGDRNPEVVDTIVRGLERRMHAHQSRFVRDIVALGGNVTHQWWLINACCIEVAPKHLPAIRKMPAVFALEPNVRTYPHIKTATDALNHNSDELNSRGITGSGVACAIIDTGQDEDMNGTGVPHITYSRRGTKATRLVRNVKIGKQPADDVHGHGTGVASIAAGWKWKTSKADHGHAYDANIVGYAIADDTKGASTAAHQVSAYQGAAKDAARYVIVATNLSYSGNPSAVAAAALAQDSAALNADLLNASSSGNNGTNLNSSLPNLNGLSVGAVSENTHALATFSSYGNHSGRAFPNLVANGVSTDMAFRNRETVDYIASGTSMSSPQVCGAATLIRAANRSLKAEETRAILLASTAKSVGATSGMNTTGTGCGYLRDDHAYRLASNKQFHGRASLTAQTTKWTKQVRVTNGKNLQVAIAWHRLDVTKKNGGAWSNLDLRLKRGTTTLASSRTLKNLEEFFRYVPTVSETLTVEVTLVGAPVGGTSQPFGWAIFSEHVPGSYSLYGKGCTGSNGTAAMSVTGVPEINASFRLSLSNAAKSTAGILWLGGQRLNASLGSAAPGCTLYCSFDAVFGAVSTGSSGGGAIWLPLPQLPNLIGIEFYNQFLVLDSKANRIGLVFSNGGVGKIGG